MSADLPLNLRRFYTSPERVTDTEAILDPEETHHLSRVLRLPAGSRVVIFDGRGGEWEAEVKNISKDWARLRLVQRLPARGEPPVAVTLGVGLPKNEALGWVVRQATEMGVKEITPFISERSERLEPARLARRLERWQRFALETLKSCQRSFLPEILAPISFAAVLAGAEELKLVFWEEERRGGLQTILKRPRPARVRLLIGPEGGFTASEVAQARAAGFLVASLGPRRLKVETAALAALALIQYAWGDLA